MTLVHNKKNKKPYCPISLLPIFSQIFEIVIYNFLINQFRSNRLFTSSQLGFLPGNLCITQLLSIINEIQTAFDNSSTVDVRDVFLDISETFDIVWHSVVLFNLQAYGFEIELIA